MISSSMAELRKIRDNNSKRHVAMTKEERKKEEEKSINWFINVIGKSVNIVNDNNIKN